jgi:thiol-disulfide isomerase/thioredoxin
VGLKRLALAVVGVVGLGLAASIYFQPKADPAVSEFEPRFAQIVAQASSEQRAHLHRTPLVLINFWASWCAPCFAETPSLLQFVKSHPDKLALISVSQDALSAEFLSFRKAFPELSEVSTLLIRDGDRHLGRLFAVEQLPETYVYQPSTRKYFRMSGALDWDRPELLSQIEKSF